MMTDRQKRIIEALRASASGKPPAEDISEILGAHRCYALLNTKNDSQSLMKRVVNTVSVKERLRACQPFFEKATFPYAVVKGAVLSTAVCGDPMRRVSGDIDILVEREFADDTKRLLQNFGFVQGRVSDDGIIPFSRKELLYHSATTHQLAPFVKKTDNPLCLYINVDVNTDILWGESGQRSDMNAVLSLREKTSLFGVEFYKLKPEAELVQLCLHHYKDMNSIYLLSQGSLKLGLFCDILFYIRNMHPSPDTVSELSKKLGVGAYVYVCFAHTNEIFCDECLTPYLEALENQRDDSLLESFGLNYGERKNWDIPLAERVLHSDLPGYLQKFLSEKDIEKIKINMENM